MVPINRRSFLQGIAATVFAGLGISKTKVEITPDTHEEFLGCLKRNHVTSKDICNEALEKIGQIPLGTRKVLPDGRVFRYCKTEAKKGEFVQADFEESQYHCGVSNGDGWVQTKGPAVANLSEQEPNQLIYLSEE